MTWFDNQEAHERPTLTHALLAAKPVACTGPSTQEPRATKLWKREVVREHSKREL